MEKDTEERLKNILLKETPILFLGAGFSIGAKTSNGREIPNGDGLKKILIEKFLKIDDSQNSYHELMSYNLKDVCQYCTNNQDEHYLNDFLTEHFSNVQPDVFHRQLTNYFWKKIYTTNIDDLVENIYSLTQKEIILQQYVRKYTYKKDNATEYFKLHGSVKNPSGGYTFTTDNYVSSIIQSRDYRMSSLSSDMHSEHFIFIGSSFDEINLDYYFKLYENTGYASTKGKIFMINPKPSLLLKSRIKKMGGFLIEWDTKQFFDFVDSLVKQKSSVGSYDLDKDVYNLGYRNIKDIRDTFVGSEDYDSKLYLGYEPQWQDIFSDWDFLDKHLIDTFNDFLSKIEKSGIFSLYGKSYIGKSTFLKRLGNELRNKGYETYNFIGRNFNYFPFLQLIRKSSSYNFAIIVDNASYHYGPLRLLTKSVPAGKKLIVITASRPFLHFRQRYNFIDEFFFEYMLKPVIDEEYAQNIVKKLDEKGYLGELKTIKNYTDRVKFVMSNNDVMSFLFSITYGDGFIKRLNRDLKPILDSDDFTKDLLVGLAIFNKLELPHFPVELISHFSNNRAKEYTKKIEGFTKTTIEQNLQLRSGFFTSNILRSVKPEKIISQIKDILILISAQVDQDSHTYWNEIHASLTREKALRQVLGLSSNQIKVLLYNIRNYYSDNFNYWIQLGIAEQREKEFEKALNHFKQAEALRPASYMVQNAIGRNFLKQANSTSSFSLAKKYFDEGEKILINLIENREELQARAFSTHCYLYEKIQFVEKFHITVKNDEIKKMADYLKRITDKDPNDIMAKHINNVFIRFLKKINRLNMIKLEFQDLSMLKALFSDYNIDIDELMNDIISE